MNIKTVFIEKHLAVFDGERVPFGTWNGAPLGWHESLMRFWKSSRNVNGELFAAPAR